VYFPFTSFLFYFCSIYVYWNSLCIMYHCSNYLSLIPMGRLFFPFALYQTYKDQVTFLGQWNIHRNGKCHFPQRNTVLVRLSVTVTKCLTETTLREEVFVLRSFWEFSSWLPVSITLSLKQGWSSWSVQEEADLVANRKQRAKKEPGSR
jgi:hypothetical protein